MFVTRFVKSWFLSWFSFYQNLIFVQQGRSAAHWASFKGHHEVLACLLKSGIDADLRDEDGKTALHLSAEYGFKRTSKVLIEHNCDIFATDLVIEYIFCFLILQMFFNNLQKGRTAIAIAAALGYQEVVAMLIQYGASLNSKDKNGNTGKFFLLFFCVNNFN